MNRLRKANVPQGAQLTTKPGLSATVKEYLTVQAKGTRQIRRIGWIHNLHTMLVQKKGAHNAA